MLHGEQYLTLHRPIPPSGTVVGKGRIVDLLDKGKDKGAVLYAERTIVDKKSGEPIATMTSAAMLRGDGGFGGKPGPQPAPHKIPETAPTKRVDIKTHPNSALIYRLSGDRNPLHADPQGRRRRRLQDADPARAVHLRRGGARHRQGLLRRRPGAPEEPAGAIFVSRVPRRDHPHRDVAQRQPGLFPRPRGGARRGGAQQRAGDGWRLGLRCALYTATAPEEDPMRVGAYYFPTDYGMDIAELARALEERGFESLFVCEHTHIPVSRRTPFPGGGELPKRYKHTHDPFVALSFAAAATKTLKIGTGIALIPQRDPIVTAKQVASLDQLSGGRFIFAMGGGWNVDEMENHGARYETRFKLLRERVLAMKELWTKEEAEFHGELVNFDPVWLYPKPKQRPHPPLLLGGESDHTLKRVVEFCDGWFPRPRSGWEPKGAVERLRKAATAAGRDPKTLSISVFAAPPDQAKLAPYREAGIDRVVLEVPDKGRDEILAVLDRNAALIKG